jgi:uracil-DNA glycosylase
MVEIAIVGEAWGAEEERQKLPFVGGSGQELTRMLREAGIDRNACFLTNVFNLRPRPSNDIVNLCGNQDEGIPGRGPIQQGKYVRAEFAPQIGRLHAELRAVNPNLILALGNSAVWALLDQTGIGKIRGTVAQSSLGIKTIPAYHPAYVLRDWSLRHVTVLDFMKAKREARFKEIRRPQRYIWIEPTLKHMEMFYDQYIKPCNLLTVDIETMGTQITCIGFAPNRNTALVVPFTDPRREGGSYWPTAVDERQAWRFVKRVLRLPMRKLFQNGMFDCHVLWKSYGIITVNPAEDTMLLHHALYPESEKGLGFLGSVYTNEPAWKMMRSRKTTLKKDE